MRNILGLVLIRYNSPLKNEKRHCDSGILWQHLIQRLTYFELWISLTPVYCVKLSSFNCLKETFLTKKMISSLVLCRWNNIITGLSQSSYGLAVPWFPNIKRLEKKNCWSMASVIARILILLNGLRPTMSVVLALGLVKASDQEEQDTLRARISFSVKLAPDL